MPIDPNLVYLVLIAGLWVGVAAIHAPGTGIMEILAVVALGGAVYALANMPTNWLALVLIVVGANRLVERRYAQVFG